MPLFRFAERSRVTSLAAPILLGLALAVIGILLLAVAFSGVSLGRPITRAWIFAAPGLVFLVPGVVVTARGLFSAFFASKAPPKGPSGPPQRRSSRDGASADLRRGPGTERSFFRRI